MNRINIDSHFNDTESSVSVAGKEDIILLDEEEEEEEEEHETPRATKRAKTTTVQSQEYTHSTDRAGRT